MIDRIWKKNLSFANQERAELWLRAAASAVHQGVLARNANGARNNPIYNRPWIELPAKNKKNDLDIVRIAFAAKIRLYPEDMIESQKELIASAFESLERKIAARAFLVAAGSCKDLFSPQ